MIIRQYFLRMIVCISLTAMLCGAFSIAHAQTVGVNELDINLELDPQNPGPNQSVTASLVSYVVNLNNYQISWFVNRSLIQTNVGLTDFTFTTADAGSSTQIEAQIIVEGQTISKIIQITPTTVDLLWEANTYVPPFYRGKKLATRQSDITVTAIPQFKNPTVDSIRTAVYYWDRNFEPQPTSSGYAKQSFTLQNSPIQPIENIDVTVKNRTETEVAAKNEEITFGDPSIVFYEKLDSRRQERKGSFTGFRINANRFNLVAIPYYFAFDRLADVRFNWQADEQSLTVNNEDPSEILFELPDKGRQTSISLSIESVPKLLQTASRNLQLIY